MRENTNYVANIFGNYITSTKELTWVTDSENRHVSQQELFDVIDDYVEQA